MSGGGQVWRGARSVKRHLQWVDDRLVVDGGRWAVKALVQSAWWPRRERQGLALLLAGVRMRHLRHDGWASWGELRRGCTAEAVKDRQARLRPSLRLDDPWVGRPAPWAVAKTPVREFGTFLGATTVGPPVPVACYAAHSDVVGLIAPPQSLKTAAMGGMILDHPGAVLSTQTKPETFRLTSALRAMRSSNGRVELLDPENLTGEKSTFRWNPVLGCRDPEIAQERAIAFTTAAGEPGKDAAWFADRAATMLRMLLFVADMGGHTLMDVWRWSGDPERMVEILQGHAAGLPRGWLEAFIAVARTQAEKTRDSIMLTLGGALEFLSNPGTAELVQPGEGDRGFDVAEFLASRSTVYLVASDRAHASVAPLLAAFTSYVFEEAKRVAAHKPGERLDPPLMLALDEVALTLPMPLDRWTPDAGGRGVHIVWAAQSRSQLRDRWGRDGSDTTWNSTTVKLVSGGLTVEDDLRGLSELCGKYRPRRDEERPILTMDQLRTLPRWHALLLHRTTPATVVRVRPVWTRRDVKRAQAGRLPVPRTGPRPTAGAELEPIGVGS